MCDPDSNIRYVCAEHAPRPQARFLDLAPASFLGQYVKIAFPIRRTRTQAEHMWCQVVEVLDDSTLVGRLDNHPLSDVGYTYGHLVPITCDQIEAEGGPV